MLLIDSNIPPPPPPPPGQIKSIVPTPPTAMKPLRKEIHHYPQVKLKNFQWKKMDARAAEKTIWDMDGDDDSHLVETLKLQGEFEKIDYLFPAKVNNFLERKLAQTSQKTAVQNDSVKFLSKEKNRNISKVFQLIKNSRKVIANSIVIDIVIFPKIKHFDSYKDVRDHIIAMDDKLCTEIFLINLITYFPSREDDLVTMEKYLNGPAEDCLKLDLPEQFTVEVSVMV